MIKKILLKKISPLLILLLLCSCSKPHELIGKWEVKKYSLWEKGMAYLKGIRSFTLGTKLDINIDSTFRMNDCGSISAGKWRIKIDSLILSIDSTVGKNNRIRKLMGGKLTKAQRVYLIDNNKLVYYHKGLTRNIERDPKDNSLKFGPTHESYEMEILKPVN